MRTFLVSLACHLLIQEAVAADLPCMSTETAPDPTGQADYVTVVRYAYDPAGRKIAEQHTYTRAGVPGEKYGQRTFTWDAAGRLAAESATLPPPAGSDTLGYTYASDAQGRITAVTRRGMVAGEPVDEVTRRTYDAAGRLVKEVLKATTGWTLTTTWRYDDAGRVVEQVEAEAGQSATTTRRTTWDAAGRKVATVSTAPDGLVEEVRYAWDPAGRLATETRLRAGQVTGETTWRYECP